MVDIRAFRGVRYNPSQFGPDLSSLTCPPYDVISASQRRSFIAQNPLNVVQLELPQDEPPLDKYRVADALVNTWRSNGTLVAESVPALYLYLQIFPLQENRHQRRGIIAALRLEPWERGIVRPHEQTLAGPKRDRLELMRACRANFSPIWCLYRDPTGATDRLWTSVEGKQAEMEATDADNVVHRVWVVRDAGQIQAFSAALATTPAYIADGHHRYETALRFRDEAGQAADSAASFAMTYFVEQLDPGLFVLGTHRVARWADPSITEASLRSVLSTWFDLDETSRTPTELVEAVERCGPEPSFGVWAPAFGMMALATLKTPVVPEDQAPGHSTAWRRLDLAALHSLVIDKLHAPGTADLFEMGGLRYVRPLDEVATAMDNGEADVAFLVRRTPVDQVVAVADANDRMPEKSTYFYPKPLTGFVIASLGGNIDG